jgi:DNA-directed RNA polymerase specialized sigma24 family protein
MQLGNKELVKGIISQDRYAFKVLANEVYSDVKKEMENIINKVNCGCNADAVLESYLPKQGGLFREKIINNTAVERQEPYQAFNTQCIDNLKFYELLVVKKDQKTISEIANHAKQNFIKSFEQFFNVPDKEAFHHALVDTILIDYLNDLSNNPKAHCDISQNSFNVFLRARFFERYPEVPRLIYSKSRQFIQYFFSKMNWYYKYPDEKAKDIEDLVIDVYMEFSENFTNKFIEKPLGLLNIICHRNVIDFFKKIKKRGGRQASNGFELLSIDDIFGNVPTETAYALGMDLVTIENAVAGGCKDDKYITLYRLHLENWKAEDIGKELGYKHRTVITYISNIKNKISGMV